MDFIDQKLETFIKESSKNKESFNSLVVQSINGIHIVDKKKLKEKKETLIIISDLLNIHKKNEIRLIYNDQIQIKQKYLQGKINLLFLLTLPQFTFNGKQSVNWILNSSIDEIKSYKTSLFKISNHLLYVVCL